jgi:hypothetical protein
MTTSIRLTRDQKRKLEQARAILQKRATRKISHGEAVQALAEFALRNRVMLPQAPDDTPRDLKLDPFYDLSIVFDFGPTEARTHDRVLYGRR